MLKLLSDEHISPAVTEQLRRHRPNLYAVAMREWENGSFLGKADTDILAEALRQRLTLLTYDQKTIRPLVDRYAAIGQAHAGIIFVDEKTIAPDEVGELVRALLALTDAKANETWTDLVLFLNRA